MATRPSPGSEAASLRLALASLVPGNWDGRTCVLELQSGGSRNWRQMEWPGWYFDFRAAQLLVSMVGGSAPGPRYGTVAFDYERTYVWDFKAHTPEIAGSGDWVVTNDVNAVDQCVANRGGLGFFIAVGVPTYSDEFRTWHQTMSGPISQYRRGRAAAGRTASRRRKGSVRMSEIRGVFLADPSSVRRALSQDWLRHFAQGRNSNDAARRAKYQIDLSRVPAWAAV